jgi:RNA polymerase sigma-70 factor, ECF subfamily
VEQLTCPLADPDDPDDDLLARLAQDEPQAARELVARKLPRLLALAQRMLGQRAEAEDVAQEAFLRVWKQAPRWRRGEARFDTWLHRVVLNLCYDRLRSPRSGHEQAVDELPEVPDAAPTPEQRLGSTQRSDRVDAALARLPARQREALVLQYYQELPQADAAELMGISVDALESLLRRARSSLRTLLLEAGPP